jgi:hypothetical protein
MSFELPETGRDHSQDRGQHHVADLLPAYLNETLTQDERGRVQLHLARCAGCRGELAAWQSVAGAARERLAPTGIDAPSPSLLAAMWDRLDAPPTPAESLERAARALAGATGRQVLNAGRVLRAQVPLIPRGIWIPSAAVLLALAFLLTSFRSGAGTPYALLGLVVPLVTAVGVALIYGPEVDPGLELTLATPTSPRLVLLCRLALVFGYNLGLATLVTLLLVLFRGASFALVASVWLGPMLLLAGLSLLFSVASGAVAGVSSVAALALLRLVAAILDTPGSRIDAAAWRLDALWRTSPAVLALAIALVALAILLVPRQERAA